MSAILVANFINSFAAILQLIINLFSGAIIVQGFLIFIVRDPYHPIASALNSFTSPVLQPVRQFMWRKGFMGRSGIDWSPMIVLVVLQFLELFIVGSLIDYAAILKR